MKLLPLLRSSHPEPAVTVTAVGTLLAAATGRPLWQVVAVFLAVLAGQLSVGWSNDWIDAARDTAVGRADKPIAAEAISARTVGIAALASAAACVPLSLLLGPVGWWHVLAVALAWAYNHPLKKTAVSLLPWAVSFGLLVAFAARDPQWWMLAAGSLLGAGAHFANALPDLAADAATGVRGLPHRLGANGSRLAAAALLLASTAMLVFSFGTWYGIAVLAVAGVAAPVAVAALAAHLVFRAVQVVALIDVVLLLAVATT